MAPPLTSKRSYVQGRKEDTATSFLTGINLRGTEEKDDTPMAKDGEGQLSNEAGTYTEATTDGSNGLRRPSRADLSSQQQQQQQQDTLVPMNHMYRSSSTPSLNANWNRRSSSNNVLESTENNNRSHGRLRKTTSPGTLPSPHSPRATPNNPSWGTHRESSSGLLSALLAREKTDISSITDSTSNSHRRSGTLQKSPTRWLGPLTDHVQLKPLIVSGTANIVKKIFRRQSVSQPKHVTSHSLAAGNHLHDRATRANRSAARSAGSQGFSRQLLSPQDDLRHIIYKGGDLSNSCVSLGENLSQHAFMFTTQRGSPLMVSSILRYNDDRAPNKRRRRRFDREYLQQITKEALIRRKANSFAHLLTQSNALNPEQEDSSSYDPYYLDDPELKTGKNRTVISLACYMGSVIQYTRPSDLKRELNEHFRTRHPNIDPAITLSKIRKVKSDLLAISEELDLEISTAALAYAYFEKLVMKGSWRGKDNASINSADSTPSPVTKDNRKLMACVCLLLAYKVNEPKRPSGEFALLMKTMTKHMEVSAKDIKEHEFQVFSLLEFNLYLPRQEFLPHFEQILYRQDYINVQEYLGEDEFYSIAPASRKPAD
ncbi:CDK5 and ABL1 enzyme substrate 1 [Gryganskiella cystojenkinii]|nr:CDK5 and ABL1 enzyme substrate 1 [Gryganskiella cystojenkinii]